MHIDKDKTLKMKYLIIISLLFLGFSSTGQPGTVWDTTKQRQSIFAYGYEYQNVSINPFGTFVPPRDTPFLRLADTGAIALVKGCFYTWTSAKRWGLIGCVTAAGPPLSILTQPASQTVNVGDGVTFSVVATGGTTPYTYQWKKNTVDIGGATSNNYNISSTISGDAGNYTVVVTDAVPNSVTSNIAVLTVVTPITITFGYGASDPYVDNSTAPTISNSATTTITHNADLSINFSGAATDKFLVFKVPAGESTKITWFVTSLNNGTIPDLAFRAPFTVSGFTYYITRDAAGFAFDTSFPVQLKQ